MWPITRNWDGISIGPFAEVENFFFIRIYIFLIIIVSRARRESNSCDCVDGSSRGYRCSARGPQIDRKVWTVIGHLADTHSHDLQEKSYRTERDGPMSTADGRQIPMFTVSEHSTVSGKPILLGISLNLGETWKPEHYCENWSLSQIPAWSWKVYQ